MLPGKIIPFSRDDRQVLIAVIGCVGVFNDTGSMLQALYPPCISKSKIHSFAISSWALEGKLPVSGSSIQLVFFCYNM